MSLTFISFKYKIFFGKCTVDTNKKKWKNCDGSILMQLFKLEILLLSDEKGETVNTEIYAVERSHGVQHSSPCFVNLSCT